MLGFEPPSAARQVLLLQPVALGVTSYRRYFIALNMRSSSTEAGTITITNSASLKNSPNRWRPPKRSCFCHNSLAVGKGAEVLSGSLSDSSLLQDARGFASNTAAALTKATGHHEQPISCFSPITQPVPALRVPLRRGLLQPLSLKLAGHAMVPPTQVCSITLSLLYLWLCRAFHRHSFLRTKIMEILEIRRC